jgi:hypothetical protein
MRASEILRKLADVIDQKSAPAPEQQHDNQHPMANGDDLIPTPYGTYLPPLQGKFELLKKAVGVDNVYDENVGNVAEDPEASNYKTTPMSPEESDALARMKKAAGVNALITSELSDDEPLDS